ncbi:MAG: adenylate/guanylate cyclase domain-containing protein [Pseudomonadota bacterium]|nr:adenylate/guanylate cyclase domain-containing protein [Pseudomonadota bacterium]
MLRIFQRIRDRASDRFGLRTPGIPITRLLPPAFAALVVVTVLPVLVLGFLGARDNTYRLLRDRNELTIDGLTERVAAHLDPVRAQLDYIAQAIDQGGVDPADAAALGRFIAGALAATPQVAGIAHFLPDGTMRRYNRSDYQVHEENWAHLAGVVEALAEARGGRGARWVAPVWSPILAQVIVTLRRPLNGPKGLHGTLVAAITTAELSAYLKRIAEDIGHTPFILVGSDQVLAHPMLAKGARTELPTLATLGDPALAGFNTLERRELAGAPFRNVQGHWSWGGDGPYGFVYRTLTDYGDAPWTLGVYYPGTETRRERWMVYAIAIGGMLQLILASMLAVHLGRRLGRPVLRLADAARHVEALEFDRVRDLGRGPIREINEASSALERMAAGLHWFETYLPRALVRRLMAAGAVSPRSEVREVTIMFTDLEGYTAFSAQRPAAEVADYLNTMLGRIGPLVEASGGTIDKYMGDGLMAFWGAPDDRPDHAAAACSGALAIAEAVTAFNRERRAAGLQACRMRIGLHSGRVVVGNIGFPGRVDYTIIGAAVNIAQRIQDLARAYGDGQEVAVLASGETARAARSYEFEHIADRLEPEVGAAVAICWLVGSKVEPRSEAAGA